MRIRPFNWKILRAEGLIWNYVFARGTKNIYTDQASREISFFADRSVSMDVIKYDLRIE